MRVLKASTITLGSISVILVIVYLIELLRSELGTPLNTSLLVVIYSTLFLTSILSLVIATKEGKVRKKFVYVLIPGAILINLIIAVIFF